jgi:serine/threonine protein kinase
MIIDPLIGQILGQYELRSLLGQGGMGAVYLAYQANLRREVAVKVLPAALVEQRGFAERFSREAQIAATLSHPHIVPIFDYGIQQNLSYVVMPYLRGGSLAQRLNQRVSEGVSLPSVAEVGEVLRQLSDALDYAHAEGIIHRDIKPGNVMFDHLGRAHLVDFGIAKLMEDTSSLIATTSIVGTPSYMAPEQWRNEALTAATDQYALGILVYHALTGRLPFEAATPYALMNSHLYDTPTPPNVLRDDLPEAISEILAPALAKDPKDRYPTVGAFADAYARATATVKVEKSGFFNFRVRALTPGVSASRNAPIQAPITIGNPILWAISVIALLIVAILTVSIFRLNSATESANATLMAMDAAGRQASAFQSSDTPTSDPQETRFALTVDARFLQSATARALQLTGTGTAEIAAVLTASQTSPSTNTPSVTATPVPSDTATSTATDTPTEINTATNTATTAPTDTSTAPASPVPSDTPTSTVTGTPTGQFVVAEAALQTSIALTVAALVEGTQTQAAQALNATGTALHAPTATPTATPTPTIPGGMVLIPAGTYAIGLDSTAPGRAEAEEVNLSPYALDRTEVTNAAFAAFVEAGGYEDEVWWTADGWEWLQEAGRQPPPSIGEDHLPRVTVTWYEADAFCRWRGARLPNDAEWEVAAGARSAGLNNRYPWGNAPPDSTLANFERHTGQLQPVQSYPASTLGLYDMAGNAREWVADSTTGGRYILRGGSYSSPSSFLRVAARQSAVPDFAFSADIGFRCAISVS